MDSTSTIAIRGDGAFGAVRLYVDAASGLEMVEKHVDLQRLTDDEVDAIEAELAITARLRHRCIMKLNGYEKTETVIRVFMDRMLGGSLSTLIAEHRAAGRRIEEATIVQYLFQLFSALDYVHKRQLVHRNLKPTNVLLTDDRRRLKVSDFGAGAAHAACNKRAELPADVVYMAPEVIDEQPFTCKCDIWSLGAIAYELVELQVPFQAADERDEHALYERITSGHVKEMRARVDVGLLSMIPKMLNVSSEQRPSCNSLLKRRLFEAMSAVDEKEQDRPAVTVRHVWQAAFDGDLARLQELLVGLPATSVLYNGMHQSDGWLHCTTPLMAAASQGHADTVRWLLDNESVQINKGGVVLNYNGITKIGRTTALMVACRQGHAAVVEVMDTDGIPDWYLCDDNGGTALMWAAFGGSLEVVDMLPHGLDVDATDKDQLTALHYATLTGRDKVVAHLLRAGADVNASSEKKWSPLHLAALNGHLAVVELLISNGARINGRNSHKSTALHIAASNGHVDVVRVLLDNGAHKNKRDVHRWPPLHHAAKNGHAAVIEALVERRADIEARTRALATPLHTAALHRRVDAIEALLNSGADIDCKDSDQWTPLHRAAYNGHTAAIQVLVRAGADVNARTSYDETPFLLAKLNNHTAAVQLLRW